MRYALIPALALLVLFLSCCSSPTHPVVGTWQLDSSAKIKAIKARAEASGGMNTRAQAEMDMFSKMSATITFAADGTCRATFSPAGVKVMKSKGTWQAEGKAVVTRMKGKDDTYRDQRFLLRGDRLDQVADDRKAGQEPILTYRRQ